MGNYPTKYDNKNKSDNIDLAKTAASVVGGAAIAILLHKGMDTAKDMYNTKRKYDSIDHGVDKVLGSLPIIGGLFR